MPVKQLLGAFCQRGCGIQSSEHTPGQIVLDAAADLAVNFVFCTTLPNVISGLGAMFHPSQGSGVQSTVEPSVPTPIQSMPNGVAIRCGGPGVWTWVV